MMKNIPLTLLGQLIDHLETTSGGRGLTDFNFLKTSEY